MPSLPQVSRYARYDSPSRAVGSASPHIVSLSSKQLTRSHLIRTHTLPLLALSFLSPSHLRFYLGIVNPRTYTNTTWTYLCLDNGQVALWQ